MAAAVLINQNHTYTDLYLPIDEQEKRWYDQINGSCTIASIIGGGSRQQGRREYARAFFERLWWYDQVVFDGSKQTNTRGLNHD